MNGRSILWFDVDFLLGNEKKIRFAVRDPSSWFGVKKATPRDGVAGKNRGKVHVDVRFVLVWIERRFA